MTNTERDEKAVERHLLSLNNMTLETAVRLLETDLDDRVRDAAYLEPSGLGLSLREKARAWRLILTALKGHR